MISFYFYVLNMGFLLQSGSGIVEWNVKHNITDGMESIMVGKWLFYDIIIHSPDLNA